MTREQKYTQQLRELGVYEPAFDPEIHTLAEMERDHQRTRKDWKASGSDVTDDLYPVLERQRKDILAHRESLGLTPRGLRRLRAAAFVPVVAPARTEEAPTPLSEIRKKYA